MNPPGVRAFLQELESHCLEKAIATFLDGDGNPLVMNLQRQGQNVIYGRWGIKELFVAKLLAGCQPTGGSLILRSFSTEIDPYTQRPVQELRGYILTSQPDDLEFEKLSPNALFACHNTDATTGEPLALEQGVRYC